ncbi:MAG: hypothetical protein AB1715_14075, partial [Acidobacteriota bacterium]
PVSAAATSSPRTVPVLTFKDGSVEEIPDQRPGVYTFAFEGQTLGASFLDAGGKNSKAPESFSAWAAGLDGRVKFGDEVLPAEVKEVAGRQTVLFQTKSGELTVNAMTEVGGRVLWIQSRGSEASLIRFLEKLEGIREPPEY